MTPVKFMIEDRTTCITPSVSTDTVTAMAPRTRRMRRLAAALPISLIALAGCSSGEDDKGTQLPPGDTAVCNAAHAGKARTVYNVRNQPTDPDLKKQANRIHPGSSDTNDTDAINQLKDRCKSIGYRFPAR